MNLDTGAAVNTFTLNLHPEVAGDGRFHQTVSDELILVGGAWQCQGYNENGLLGSLNGRLTWSAQSFVQKSRAKEEIDFRHRVETLQCFKSLECVQNVFACCLFVVFPSSS